MHIVITSAMKRHFGSTHSTILDLGLDMICRKSLTKNHRHNQHSSVRFHSSHHVENDSGNIAKGGKTNESCHYNESEDKINRIIPSSFIHNQIFADRSSEVLFAHVQSGTGSIVAESSPKGGTQLTKLCHKSPARLIPLLSSNISNAGAAVAVLSNYGGGLLSGDSLRYDVTCRGKNSKLALITQGSNRIYRQRQKRQYQHVQEKISTNDDAPSAASLSSMNVTVENGGTIVLAPDPVSVFTDSVYIQQQELIFERDSNACMIDWISSGRYLSGEQWQQRSLQTTTSVYVKDISYGKSVLLPVLVDSVSLKQLSEEHSASSEFALSATPSSSWGMKQWSNGYQWNAFASIVLYGTEMEQVVERCYDLQNFLLRPYTNVRSNNSDISELTYYSGNNSDDALNNLSLSGRAMMGVTKVQVPARTPTSGDHDGNIITNQEKSVYVVRLTAMSNEDLYRIFHACLLPMKSKLGTELYKDRIRSSSPQLLLQQSMPLIPNKYGSPKQIPERLQPLSDECSKEAFEGITSGINSNIGNYWVAYMLADSALPTGAFAHSSGMEVAHQLGLISTPEDVSTFVQCATQSVMQQSAPFIQYCSILLQRLQDNQNLDSFKSSWKFLDQHANARLVSNGPACRTSLEQGHSLLRVAMQFVKNKDKSATLVSFNCVSDQEILQILDDEINSTRHSTGHLSTIFGVVSGILLLNQSEACQLLGYCIARDIVSAAVRLSLVGPMASIGVLLNAQKAAEAGFCSAFVTQKKLVIYQPQSDHDYETEISSFVANSAGCAPLLDSIQPCHDVLATRLFRT